MEIIRTTVLDGFPHGFTGRVGGASVGPFASANLGAGIIPASDAAGRAAVAENWARLERSTGLRFARPRQVHGREVLLATGPEAALREADGLVSATEGLAACVLAADCVPILIADPRSGAVAAVHAGWRGTIARIAAAGVLALVRERGARPQELRAAIGPAIGPCCYEVAIDLAERFAREVARNVASTTRGGPRLDLWLANRMILKEIGLPSRQIETIERCTSCEDESFFSHRRDEGTTGRQAGFIAPRPAAG
jgi:YfiH family protein